MCATPGTTSWMLLSATEASRPGVGALRANVTPETGYGSVSDIRNTIAKNELLTFIDHYGDTYTVVVQNNGSERSLSPQVGRSFQRNLLSYENFKVA